MITPKILFNLLQYSDCIRVEHSPGYRLQAITPVYGFKYLRKQQNPIIFTYLTDFLLFLLPNLAYRIFYHQKEFSHVLLAISDHLCS